MGAGIARFTNEELGEDELIINREEGILTFKFFFFFWFFLIIKFCF